jgi:hypothetical protein
MKNTNFIETKRLLTHSWPAVCLPFMLCSRRGSYVLMTDSDDHEQHNFAGFINLIAKLIL